MKISVDLVAGSAYLRFRESEVGQLRMEELQPGLWLERDASGSILGLEVLEIGPDGLELHVTAEG